MLSYVAEEQTNVTDATATVTSNEGGFMATVEVMATNACSPHFGGMLDRIRFPRLATE